MFPNMFSVSSARKLIVELKIYAAIDVYLLTTKISNMKNEYGMEERWPKLRRYELFDRSAPTIDPD